MPSNCETRNSWAADEGHQCPGCYSTKVPVSLKRVYNLYNQIREVFNLKPSFMLIKALLNIIKYLKMIFAIVIFLRYDPVQKWTEIFLIPNWAVVEISLRAVDSNK